MSNSEGSQRDFDQNARKILIDHYRSKNNYHGVNLLTLGIIFFALTQEGIKRFFPDWLIFFFMSTILTFATYVFLKMVWFGLSSRFFLTAYPKPPFEQETRDEAFFETHLLSLEYSASSQFRATWKGAVLHIVTKTGWGVLLLLSEWFLFYWTFFITLLPSTSGMAQVLARQNGA